MDRARRRPGVLIAPLARALPALGLLALALLAAAPLATALGAGNSPPPPLRAMRWLTPGADAARILTRQPPECFRPPADPALAYSAELGRVAFRTPLLLGGQAARAGVACETCHRNGRTNPDFDFPGLSGAPGTADVTSSLFSSHRGDGVDNPKPIPDLGGPKAQLKIDQDPASPALETFIHGLVTQEFDGAEPPPAVLKGLADYVRSMDPAACGAKRGEMVLGPGLELAVARRAVQAARAALIRRDLPAAALMTMAARSALGDIAERYPADNLARDRAALARADEGLKSALAVIRAGDAAGAGARLGEWLAFSRSLAVVLTADQEMSLYSPRMLRRR